MVHVLTEKRSYSSIHSTHQHLFAQLIFPLIGELCVHTKSFHGLITERLLLFIPPRDEHMFFATGCNEFLVLDIPQGMLPMAQQTLNRESLIYALDDKWRAIRLLVLNAINHGGSVDLKTLLPYVFTQLFRNRQAISIQYLHQHFDEDVTLKTLASLENYSVSYYTDTYKNSGSRKSKSCFGKPTSRFRKLPIKWA